MKEVEEMRELQSTFLKSADIIEEIIKLSEELEKEKDEEKIKEINNKLEEKTGLFMFQMIKISKFN